MSERVVFLTLRTFSMRGGIEKVCAIFSKVLSDLAKKGLVEPAVLSAYDNTADCEEKYIDNKYFCGYNKKKIKFLIAALKSSFKANQVILSHINLLVIAKLLKKISPKTKVILIAHGIEVWREISPGNIKFLRTQLDEIWAVSNFTAKVMSSKHQVPEEKIKVVNNCLDPFLTIPVSFEKPVSLLERYNLSRQQKILFTLTRLTPSELFKGYDSVINILPQLIKNYPDLIYLIAGKPHPDEKARLEKKISELGLEKHVRLLGYLPDEELTQHFLLADVFVMPSKKEGFGIVFIEAAACGCKVIGGNIDGSVDALLDGKLGTLIVPDSEEQIRGAISESLQQPISTNNATLQQQLCLQHFSYNKYLQQIQNLLKSA